jgi:hypothetical protein
MGSTSSPFSSMTTYRRWASCVSTSTTRIFSSFTSQVFLPVSSLFSIPSVPNQIYQDNASLRNRKKQQGILCLPCCLCSKGIEIRFPISTVLPSFLFFYYPGDTSCPSFNEPNIFLRRRAAAPGCIRTVECHARKPWTASHSPKRSIQWSTGRPRFRIPKP